MKFLNPLRKLFLCLFITALAACTNFADEAGSIRVHEGDIVLNNGVFLNPRTQTQREGGLIIRNGKIFAKLDTPIIDFSAKIIDLNGKFVIPGLIDLHTHSFGNQIPGAANDNPGTEAIAERILQAGVTGFLDLFGDEDVLYEVRERQRRGDIGGADIHASLSCVTAPKGHCAEYGIPTRTLTSPKEAVKEITELAVRKPDIIKIVYQPSDDQPSIDKATFESVVATAKKMNLKTVVHIKTWQDVRDAMDVGATAITHIPRGPIPADLPKLMAQNKIIVIPTLTVHTDFVNFLFDPEVLDAPLARKLVPVDLINAYRDEALIDKYRDRRISFEDRNKETLASVRAMVKADVPILVGTDSGNWGTIQGYSTHREMIKLVEAGLSSWEAIAAATTLAGDFLSERVDIEIGAPANLVILNVSPIQDISNTQKIEIVIHHGRLIAL